MTSPVRCDAASAPKKRGKAEYYVCVDLTHSAFVSALGRGCHAATCRCGWRTHHADLAAAKQATAAHNIFHHVTGSYLCGADEKKCRACKAILEIRADRGLRRQFVAPWQRSQIAALGQLDFSLWPADGSRDRDLLAVAS